MLRLLFNNHKENQGIMASSNRDQNLWDEGNIVAMFGTRASLRTQLPANSVLIVPSQRAYNDDLLTGKHIVGKLYTQRIERENLTLHTG